MTAARRKREAAAAKARATTPEPLLHTPAPPRPRDRAATEERLLAAVGDVLAREGFRGLGVGAVAREAGVDKVLIYRYFGGLPELLRAWGASGRFWPRVGDLLQRQGEGFLQRPAAERWAVFLADFIDELRARPLTLAVLAAELEERNELTAILEAEREEWGAEATRVLGGGAFAASPHLRGITLLVVAGVQYLALRARRIRLFGGVDIQSEAGWLELKASIGALAGRIVPPTLP
ncbi:MAG: TetR/AcrR family transcriptional regulator [Rubrivivax sp.]|nr:TetR/AcrR family transcriptional regulator [Rubrivivax sp.]